MSTKELREQRAKLVSDARKILDKAEGEKRSLLGEEETAWQAYLAEADALKVKIDRLEKQESLETELTEVRNQKQIGRTDLKPAERTAQDMDRKQAAFRSYLRHGERGLSGEMASALEYRALGAGSGSIGGYTVPQGFYDKMVDVLKSYVGVRQAPVTVITTESGNDMPVPKGDDTGNTGELLAENTQTASNADPSFAQVLLKAYNYSSKVVLVPIQLIQDNAVDLEGWLTNKLGQRIGRAQAPHFITGTGSGQPEGLLTNIPSGNKVTAASATDIDVSELVDLEHKIDPAYRVDKASCGYLFNDDTLRILKRKKDSYGRPLWVPGVASDEPDTVWGYKYFIDQNMATVASAAKSVAFGNFSYYFVRDVVGAGMLRLTERYADYFQVGFLGWMRSDGKNTNPAAFSLLVQSVC